MVAKKTKKKKWTINGESQSFSWDEQESLLTVLRREMDLCSVKAGCEQGDCGSCTVLLNDVPVLACQTEMSDVIEQTVTTWEGMPAEVRNRYANGLAQAGLACGFCVPGMLMHWHTECAEGQRPSREQILHLLSEHYCRCTGYASWLHALQHMSLSGTRRHMPTISLWNGSEMQNIPRLSENFGTLHLLGRLLAGEPYFVDDLKVPQMLEATLVFVPQAFGVVENIDWKDALTMAGVEAVLSAKGVLCKTNTTKARTIPDTLEFDFEETGEQFMMHTLDSIQSPTQNSAYETEPVQLFDDESLLQMQGGVSPTLESFVGLVSFQDWSELEREEVDSEEFFRDSHDDKDLAGVKEAVETKEPSVVVELPGAPLLVDVGQQIRSCGDVVAVVVATDHTKAKEAAQSIAVAVEEDEEPTLDAEYASQRGWEDEAVSVCWESGNVTAVFHEAHAVVSGTWTTSSVDSGCLEPPSCLVVPGRSGRLKVFSAGRSAANIRSVVATSLNKDVNDIDVSLLPAGGSFDTRLTPVIESYAAKVAMALGRPVKITLSRDDMSRMLPKRHACRIHMSMACDIQGRILALRVDFLADTGGLARDADVVLRQAMAHAFGPYRVPHFSIQGKMLCSNLPHAGAVTGDGVAQVTFALESLMDMMSQRLGIDGWVLRYSNVLEPGDVLPNGSTMGPDCRAKQTLEAMRELFYKHEDCAGIACSWLGCDEFSHPESEVRVSLRMDAEERCHVMLPRGDCGKNLYVRVLQLLADESGLKPDSIVLNVGASEHSNVTVSKHSAMATSSWGVLEAVRRAARKLCKAMGSQKSLAHQEFVGVWKWHESIKTPMAREDGHVNSTSSLPSLGTESYQMPLYRGYSFATQLVVLHQEHGRLRRVITACDLGHPNQPEIFSQQIEGSVHAGLGYALREEFPTDEGMPRSCTLRDMGSIQPEHTPHLQTILVTTPDHGQESHSTEKGEGDVAMFGVAPAIASAIFRHQGQRFYHLPLKQSHITQTLETPEA